MKNVRISQTSTSQPQDQNYYADSFSMNKKKQYDDHGNSYVDGRTAHYNSGYHSDGQDSKNHYAIPKVSIEDSEVILFCIKVFCSETFFHSKKLEKNYLLTALAIFLHSTQ